MREEEGNRNDEGPVFTEEAEQAQVLLMSAIREEESLGLGILHVQERISHPPVSRGERKNGRNLKPSEVHHRSKRVEGMGQPAARKMPADGRQVRRRDAALMRKKKKTT